MSRRFHTADDLLRLAATGVSELVVAPGDRLTPAARDVAGERGIRVVVGPPPSPGVDLHSSPMPEVQRLRHVTAVNTMDLAAFPVELRRPEMDVRLRDVITSADGMPMAAGVMSLRQGSFPWTLDYDEVEFVLEGELHITRGSEVAVGRPGDVIAVPKGSSITFGTPSWAKFFYVTYPADWGGAP